MEKKLECRILLKAEIHFVLNETEAKALDALAGYGTDNFLKCFYTHMGKAYLEPHERGLRSLFEKIKDLAKPIDEIEAMRKKMQS